MITAEQYLAVVRRQLRYAGARVYEAPIGPQQALVGEFGQQHPLGYLHYCVTVATADLATDWVVRDFTLRSNEFARSLTVPGIRGLDSGVLTVAGIVAGRADDGARWAATDKSATLGSASRSVLVDLQLGTMHSYTGTPFWGAAAEPAVKQAIASVFPPPAAVAVELGVLPPQDPAGPESRTRS